jgi:hypothetical protein
MSRGLPSHPETPVNRSVTDRSKPKDVENAIQGDANQAAGPLLRGVIGDQVLHP